MRQVLKNTAIFAAASLLAAAAAAQQIADPGFKSVGRAWPLAADLRSGAFETQAMLDFWDRTLAAAMAVGYRFSRAVGEMTWATRKLPGVEELIGYEARLNRFLPRYPQVMVNVRVQERTDPWKSVAIQAAVERVERQLGPTGRVVLRASGTEPVIRVMVEGREADQVSRLANDLAETVRKAV